MNTKHLIWANPHLPVTGERPAVKRRKRAKLMFEEQCEVERIEADETAKQEYHERRGKK